MSAWSRQKYSYSHFRTNKSIVSEMLVFPQPLFAWHSKFQEDCSEERDFYKCYLMELEGCAFQGGFFIAFLIRYLPGEETQVRGMSTCLCSSTGQGSWPVPPKWGHCCCSHLSCSLQRVIKLRQMREITSKLLNKWMRNWEIVIDTYTLLHYV